MTSVPYPCFRSHKPVGPNRAALSCVGRCRIVPDLPALLAKNKEQAHEDDKQTRKKFMKQGVAMAKEYIKSLGLDSSITDVEVVVSAQDLILTDGCLASCWLDAGCAKIVTDGANLDALDAAAIPKDRLMAHFVFGEDLDLAAAAPLCTSCSIELTNVDDVQQDKVLEMMDLSLDMEVVVMFRPTGQLESHEKLAPVVGRLCEHASQKGSGTLCLIDPTAEQLGYSYAACIRTDRPDGLFTTVVCTRSGEALGLVYSSKDSIVAALECGRGVYYSRSRQSLWRKGDTSGHFQTLHRIDVDCDGDALRFMVTQRGDDHAAFCHLNTLTCWGQPHGIRHLEETLQERLKSAPAGSYTKRLFEDSELLKDKLVEEAQELAEAQSKQHVAEECADLIYFAMVRATQAGVSIDDAVAELDARTRKVTRRKGDSKAFRIAAGKAILDKK